LDASQAKAVTPVADC